MGRAARREARAAASGGGTSAGSAAHLLPDGARLRVQLAYLLLRRRLDRVYLPLRILTRLGSELGLHVEVVLAQTEHAQLDDARRRFSHGSTCYGCIERYKQELVVIRVARSSQTHTARVTHLAERVNRVGDRLAPRARGAAGGGRRLVCGAQRRVRRHPGVCKPTRRDHRRRNG